MSLCSPTRIIGFSAHFGQFNIYLHSHTSNTLLQMYAIHSEKKEPIFKAQIKTRKNIDRWSTAPAYSGFFIWKRKANKKHFAWNQSVLSVYVSLIYIYITTVLQPCWCNPSRWWNFFWSPLTFFYRIYVQPMAWSRFNKF